MKKKLVIANKANYQYPKVERIQLKNLSFLVQGFSGDGELDPIDDGGEFGLDEFGNPI